MQKMWLFALIRAKKCSLHSPGVSDAHVSNVLKRDFCATAPNQKWATDVTEFNVNGTSSTGRPAWTCTTARSSRTA